MSIFGKLVTLFRGTAHEAGEKVVDAKALTILDQEIRDAASQLEKSKVDLARLMGQSKLADNEIAAREQKIAEYGRYIEGALAKGDEPLALQVAEKLAPVETEQSTARTSKTSLDQSIATLRSTIGKTEQRLKQMRAQVDQVKATDTVQRAQAAIAARHAGIEAWGFEARDVESPYSIFTELRRFPSALRAYLDVWTGAPARDGAAPVKIGIDPAR